MRPFKKILVPTDFSKCAEEATRAAVELAKRFEGSLTLLHVYEIPAVLLPEGAILAASATMTDITRNINEALATAKKQIVGVPVETQMIEGVPFVEVVGAAKQGNFDLIVIGTHGRTGIKHFLLGSVAERVVRKAPCPVLTVRESNVDVEAGTS
jgi:nucleotide-binding universal stress UspA family protein